MRTGVPTPVSFLALEFRAATPPAARTIPMARDAKPPKPRKSPYTADRNVPGAFEGETVTRRGLFTGGALAAGGIASAAFGLPALGFALGPLFERTEQPRFTDVGS